MTTSTDRTPPSTWAIAFATALIAGLTGYFLGQASSIGLFGGGRVQEKADDQHELSDSSGEEDRDEDKSGHELKGFADRNEECKLVLVVRTDLGMTKGVLCRSELQPLKLPSPANVSPGIQVRLLLSVLTRLLRATSLFYTKR